MAASGSPQLLLELEVLDPFSRAWLPVQKFSFKETIQVFCR